MTDILFYRTRSLFRFSIYTSCRCFHDSSRHEKVIKYTLLNLGKCQCLINVFYPRTFLIEKQLAFQRFLLVSRFCKILYLHFRYYLNAGQFLVFLETFKPALGTVQYSFGKQNNVENVIIVFNLLTCSIQVQFSFEITHFIFYFFLICLI